MPFTKEQVKKQLEAWMEANLAVSSGQSYKIGSRNLTRANATEVLNQIKYWQGQLDTIEAAEKGRSRSRIYSAIPRDF